MYIDDTGDCYVFGSAIAEDIYLLSLSPISFVITIITMTWKGHVKRFKIIFKKKNGFEQLHLNYYSSKFTYLNHDVCYVSLLIVSYCRKKTIEKDCFRVFNHCLIITSFQGFETAFSRFRTLYLIFDTPRCLETTTGFKIIGFPDFWGSD